MTSNEATLDQGGVASIVDPLFDQALASHAAPGIAYGVVFDGELVHSRGIGVHELDGDAPPDADTVFRIASMTKSFTAATVLSLRDDGSLSLDARVAEVVPELAAGGALAQAITVRHLLTMGAGFLTDDPWGDRQQDLPAEEFLEILRSGVRPQWSPGERFEYSNLGYALIGVVIEAVTGRAYADVVRSRLLGPLELSSTGYRPSDLAQPNLAIGYVRRTTGWMVEPLAGPGAFSPMGGLFSSVNDLATWVGLFQSVHRAGAQSKAIDDVSVREMQVTQRLVGASASKDEGGAPDVIGYGFGLFEEFGATGRSVQHSGGYPGFGSHMRWHPASGWGIVALGNGSYAPVSSVAAAALRHVVEQTGAQRRPAPVALPGLELAHSLVSGWLGGPDPESEPAGQLRARCADNVELDVPWGERVAQWQGVRASHGALVDVPGSQSRPSPGSLRWLMYGPDESRTVQVTVLMAPHEPALIQSMVVKALGTVATQTPAATDVT